MEEMELSDRRRLFKKRGISDWRDVDPGTFDGIGCDAEP